MSLPQVATPEAPGHTIIVLGDNDDLTGLHGSAEIEMADGRPVPIQNLRSGDMVMGANGVPAEVIQLQELRSSGPSRKCALFIPSSLGDGVPNALLAIDDGHPIYALKDCPRASKALKTFHPAREYGKGSVRWENMDGFLSCTDIRYGLVLASSSCGAYIANGGVVVKGADLV